MNEMIKKLVTVVVPVYNVQHYLDRCLVSIVNQSYQELEIILVDDGSTDGSGILCDDWAQKDSRITVIHKKNAGLGMARNTGIDHASGQYICFFDSDDYIDAYTIEHAVELAEKELAQIVVFGMVSVDFHGRVVQRAIPESQKTCYRSNEVLEELLPSILQPAIRDPKTRNLRLSACSCLFLQDLIDQNKWKFVTEREIISEDVYSLLDLYRYVKAAAVLQEALYYYCENAASLTHSYRADRYERNKYFYNACIRLCERGNYPEVVKKSCMSPFLGNTIAALKQEAEPGRGISTSVAGIRNILCDALLQQVLSEKRHDPQTFPMKLLFWVMRKKWIRACYLLLAAHGFMTRLRRQLHRR